MDGSRTVQIYGDEHGILRNRTLCVDRHRSSDYCDWGFGVLLHGQGTTSASLRGTLFCCVSQIKLAKVLIRK